VTRTSESLTRFLPACIALAAVAAAFAPTAAAAGPVLTKRPTVVGDATQGSRVVVSHGSWSGGGALRYSYQWYRCDTMGRHCLLLRGVDRRAHTLGAGDVGHTLSVAVRAAGAGGSVRAFASLVGPIAGRRPHLDALTQPVVVGLVSQGATLRVGTGRWRPRPSGFVYQWARCNAELRACSAISGETANTHAIAPADLGHVLVAIVQARTGATSRAVFSTATALAAEKQATPAATKPAAAPSPVPTGTGPSNSVIPAIAEVIQQGHQVTGSVGSWTGTGTISYTYNWYRCDATGAHCSSVHGATKATYTLGAKDVGHTLGFAVHARDTTGTATGYASLIGPVAAPDATLVSTAAPVIGGTAAAGQVLQVSGGSWSEPPSALAYQWQRCNANGRLCTPISGATAYTYPATAEDAGHRLLAVVHATAGTAAQDVLSIASGLVGAATPAGPSNTAAPTVAGTLERGSQLTGNVGTWTGSGTIAYTYNWFRCDSAGAHCLSIHGATNATYTIGGSDAGHTLGFAVHAADANGTSTGYASLVGPIAAGGATFVATGAPAISGTVAAGQALQVSNGSWNQTPTGFTYQWLRCNANGRLCAAIDGATGSSYTVTSSDSGHTLVAVVTGALNGTQQPALSTHTALVP
jgi:large repetitive protein